MNPQPPARVYWKAEVEEEGAWWGPAWVYTLDGAGQIIHEAEWDRWVPRSEAEEFARANGFDLMVDE